jgi:two-component system response regulator (stage 0 sporulation protein F)
MANILIADDQYCVQELLCEELTEEGYMVQTASDAESVRTQIRSSRPDLLLLDLYLDGPDGFELLRYVKREHPDLPVIIYTAYDTYVDDPRLSQADAYVVKSFDFMQLKQWIADVLRHKSVLQAKVVRSDLQPSRLPFMKWQASQTQP